jgi:endonuclease/exonuclease/phosphatase family metal-dependent hydrolase
MGTQRLGIDDEMILTRYPVLATAQQPLFPGFRKALWARIDHPLGAVDVFTTHLASGSDGGPVPCTADLSCPPECIDAGASNRRDCQAVQLAAFIDAVHDVDGPAVLAGDFNAEPRSFIYRTFADRGWSDVYLAAGNPECDPSSGAGCTSGRADESLVELESPANNEVERIDFIFLLPPRGRAMCRYALDPAADRDGDGAGTGLFAAEPNPFAESCGPRPAPICWPSDHQGVQLDANCH